LIIQQASSVHAFKQTNKQTNRNRIQLYKEKHVKNLYKITSFFKILDKKKDKKNNNHSSFVLNTINKYNRIQLYKEKPANKILTSKTSFSKYKKKNLPLIFGVEY